MSFIRDFVEYTEGTECPKPYVIWTAYGVLSAAIGPRVYYADLKYIFTRCDIYVLLIGPSGGKKTATMLLGLDILREAIPDVNIAGDNETYQGIITFLHSDNSTRSYVNGDKQEDYKPYHIFAEEFMDYLQLNQVAMIKFLTAVYGKKAYLYRLKNEDRMLINPYITMCACSVPEWLTDQLNTKQFSAGIGRRAIMVCSDTIIRKKPHMTDAMAAARVRCVDRLRQIPNIVGPIILEPDADKEFWNRYINTVTPDDAFLKDWYSTRHFNILKVAILTSLSERDDRVVTLDHIDLATGLVDEVEKNLGMVTQRLGRSEVAEPSLRLLSVLKGRGNVMSMKELKMATYKDFRDGVEQFRVIEFLRSTGQIVVEDLAVNGVKKQMVALSDAIKKV